MEYAMSGELNSAVAKSQLITRFKHRDYEVLLIRETDHRGYSVLCPELGCASQGDDREEALEMIAEAISNLRDYDSAIADYDAALRRDPYDQIAVAALESSYIALWQARQSA